MVDRYSLEWLAAGVRLRAFEPTLNEVRHHGGALAGYYNEPTNRALLTNEVDFDPEDVADMFEEMWEEGDRPFLLYADDELVGDCDLRNVERDHAEYAILVGPRATQGKGLGTRFGTMILTLAFGPLAMHRIYASIRPENTASLRMFQKIGYTVDASPGARQYAEKPDDVCVSIGAEHFRRLHAEALRSVRIETRSI